MNKKAFTCGNCGKHHLKSVSCRDVMKRIIKFRAWDKDHKEMCDVFGISWHWGTIALSRESGNPKNWFRREHFELMQFTGIKDRNGKDIYDGDILQRFAWGNKIDRVDIVDWSDKWGAWFGNGEPLNSPTLQNSPDDEFEVIGNIYENPELIP